MRTRIVRTLAVTALAVPCILAGATAQTAPPPVALVLEVAGATVPAIAPYAEVAAGAAVSLPPGARLVFLHYQTCTMVTVVGGEIVIGQASYRAAGGSAPIAQKTTCPPRTRLKDAGDTAGITLRSLTPPSGLSTRPSFVVVGAGAPALGRVRVVRGAETVLDEPLAGREFRWPAGAAALDPSVEYELVLLPAGTGGRQATLKFRPTEPPAAATGSPLTVIRVDP